MYILQNENVNRENRKLDVTCLPGDSRNYMPPILIPSSGKHIATQILVIAKLNQRKYFILRIFVCDIIRPARNYLSKSVT